MFHKTSPMVENQPEPSPGGGPDEGGQEEEEEIPDIDEYDASGKNPFA